MSQLLDLLDTLHTSAGSVMSSSRESKLVLTAAPDGNTTEEFQPYTPSVGDGTEQPTDRIPDLDSAGVANSMAAAHTELEQPRSDADSKSYSDSSDVPIIVPDGTVTSTSAEEAAHLTTLDLSSGSLLWQVLYLFIVL